MTIMDVNAPSGRDYKGKVFIDGVERTDVQYLDTVRGIARVVSKPIRRDPITDMVVTEWVHGHITLEPGASKSEPKALPDGLRRGV